MTSNRPYLLRALNEWILDNQMTPYVLVDADTEVGEIPTQFIKDGQIVLNISPAAVRGLIIDKEFIAFTGRFGGAPYDVRVPIDKVLAIYAKESNEGMIFPAVETDRETAGHTIKSEKQSHLKVVK